ncbi:hypothetical protein HN51_027083 [Arachis hypogaea]
MVELQGLKSVEGEDPPKILHLNPRLRGDWSKRPVIEHNICYRMHWRTAQRCNGLSIEDDEGMLEELSLQELCCSDRNGGSKLLRRVEEGFSERIRVGRILGS